MRTIADLFERRRGLVGLALLVITLVALAGHLIPARVQHPLERYETAIDSPVETHGDRVSNRLDLARSDAFLVVECADFFQPEMVRAIRRMVAAVEELPIVEGVFWADRVPLLNVFGLADPLVPADDASPAAFAAARGRLLSHPLARQLVSDDGRTLLMPVVYDWLEIDPAVEGQTTTRIVETARAALNPPPPAGEGLGEGGSVTGQENSSVRNDSPSPKPSLKWRGTFDLRVRLTGRVPLFTAQQSAFDRNQIFFQALGYLLAFVLAIVMFRGVAAVAVVSLAPALGVFWALGVVQLLGVPSNPLGQIVMPVLVSMIGLTDGVHLLVHVRRRRLAGATPVAAARSAIENVGLACWLTSLTTAIGFASLLLAESDYVQDFGRVCCIGVLIAFVAVVTFVPWVSSTWVGRYIQRGEERDVVGGGVERLGGLIDWVLGRRWVVSAAAVVVTIALTGLSLTLTPDNRMATAMPASSEAYQALAHCDEQLGGIQFFNVELTWTDEGVEDDPRLLAVLDRAEQLINDEPLISYPLSVRAMLASFPGGLGQGGNANDLETQMTFLSLLPEQLRGFFYDPEERRAVISVRIQDRGIARYKPIFERLEADLENLTSEYPGFAFDLVGQPVDIARDLYQIVDDLRVSLGAASLIILVVLAVVYRSVRVGLISVVPNLFPLVATGAWIAVSGGTLDMSGVCAFVVCLGIAVDDTVHFLSRFQQELESGPLLDDQQAETHAAIRRAFIGVGAPLVMTTIILCTGFGTMLLSDLPGHRTFAAMACSTIAAAILGDLIALPPLLSCFFRGGSNRQVSAAAQPEPDTSAVRDSPPAAATT